MKAITMTVTTGVMEKLVRLFAAVKEQANNPFGLTREALRNAVFIRHMPVKNDDAGKQAKPGKGKQAAINYFSGPHCVFATHM